VLVGCADPAVPPKTTTYRRESKH